MEIKVQAIPILEKQTFGIDEEIDDQNDLVALIHEVKKLEALYKILVVSSLTFHLKGTIVDSLVAVDSGNEELDLVYDCIVQDVENDGIAEPLEVFNFHAHYDHEIVVAPYVDLHQGDDRTCTIHRIHYLELYDTYNYNH